MTPGQQATLAAFDAFVAQHGYAPSYRELAALSGRSVTLVARHVARLVEAGVLAKDYAVHRSLRRVPERTVSQQAP